LYDDDVMIERLLLFLKKLFSPDCLRLRPRTSVGAAAVETK